MIGTFSGETGSKENLLSKKNSMKKYTFLELLEFQQQVMIDTFLIQLTQFERNGSLDKNFISLRNLIIKFHFRNIN